MLVWIGVKRFLKSCSSFTETFVCSFFSGFVTGKGQGSHYLKIERREREDKQLLVTVLEQITNKSKS